MSVSDELLRRLIELQEQQVAAINRLADKEQAVHAPEPSPMIEFEEILNRKMAEMNSVDVSSGQSGQNIYTKELIVESGKRYTRQSHPLLFTVVDYLEGNEGARVNSVRKIAELVTKETGQSVGKSWAAVAKNYWQSKPDTV